MIAVHKFYVNIAIALCLTLLLAQTVSAQTESVFEGRTWSDFDPDRGAKAACDNELDADTTNDDIDEDNDGLIELCYLEDVDAMRHDLGGTSLKRGDDILNSGCPSGGCNGYELVRNLDFSDDTSYSSTANKVIYTVDDYEDSNDSGWQPIGDYTNVLDNNPFNSIFEGNGHTIANLMINRPNAGRVGLFSYTGSSSKISNIGLLNVRINGQIRPGGLISFNDGAAITNSYATGFVNGADGAGGLIGYSTGGTITNSYATASVDTKKEPAGGLIGWQNTDSITNSYATGAVKGRLWAGGLVGYGTDGTITNSYATGSGKGGLVGAKSSNGNHRTEKSYWDTETSGITTSAGGEGKTTDELQSPTAATGIYSSWSTDNWDFGSTGEYPALKYATECGASQQPACGALLKGQERNSQPRIIAPQNNDEIRISESDANTTKKIAVTVSDDDINDELTLLLSAVDEDQNLVVLETTKTQVMTNGKPKRDINEVLSIKVPQNIISGTTTLRLVAEDNSGFYNAMSEPILLKVLAGNIQPTITPIPSDIGLLEGTSTTLNVVIKDDNDDPISVSLDSDSTAATATITATGNANHILKITASSEGTATITVTMDDGKGEVNSVVIVKFTVEVEANDAPMLEILSQPNQPIELGATTSVGISIRDTNFDFNDRVAITVRSSTQSVVLVTPKSISDIDSNTTQTFTLTGKAIGESRISFTATDRNRTSSTVSVLLRVFSSLTLTDKVPTAPVVATVGAAFNLDTGTFFTYRGNGTLSYAVTALPAWLSFDTATGVLSGTPPAADASTDMNGLSVTVTASDSSDNAEAMFTLLMNAEPSGMPTIGFDSWQLTADTRNVMDANGIAERNYQWFRGNTEVGTNSNTYTIKDNNEERAGGTEYKVDVGIRDSIGQVTTFSAIYTVINEAPVIDSVMPTKPNYDEDETVSITASASDANNDDLTYTWSVTSRDTDPSILMGSTKTNEQIGFDIPADWVVNPSTATGVTETLQLQVTVNDGNLNATQMVEVVVTKIDNGKVGTPSISGDADDVDLFTLRIDLASDPDDENDNPNLNYQWQRCLADADCSPQGD